MNAAELEAVAARFDVGMDQVRRDHLISHVLGAIARGVPSEDLIFLRRDRPVPNASDAPSAQ